LNGTPVGPRHLSIRARGPPLSTLGQDLLRDERCTALSPGAAYGSPMPIPTPCAESFANSTVLLGPCMEWKLDWESQLKRHRWLTIVRTTPAWSLVHAASVHHRSDPEGACAGEDLIWRPPHDGSHRPRQRARRPHAAAMIPFMQTACRTAVPLCWRATSRLLFPSKSRSALPLLLSRGTRSGTRCNLARLFGHNIFVCSAYHHVRGARDPARGPARWPRLLNTASTCRCRVTSGTRGSRRGGAASLYVNPLRRLSA